MTATNHVLTGVVIGSVVHQPALALPIAFASHFVCDAIPHFGNSHWVKDVHKGFIRFLLADCTIAGSILLWILIAQPQNWLLLIACGVLAASPDLMWLPNYIRVLRRVPQKPFKGYLVRFHTWVQWAERPGLGYLLVEFAWASFMLTLFVRIS